MCGKRVIRSKSAENAMIRVKARGILKGYTLHFTRTVRDAIED
jgi:hypothetical protein